MQKDLLAFNYPNTEEDFEAAIKILRNTVILCITIKSRLELTFISTTCLAWFKD